VPSAGDLLSGLQGIPKLALKYLFSGIGKIGPMDSKIGRINLLKRVEFYSTIEAGGLGLLSGLLLVLITAMVDANAGSFSENLFWDHVIGLGIIFLLGAIVTVGELVGMYFLSLRNARLIATINEQSTAGDDIDEGVMIALVNAGLQTPNLRGEFHGINPRADLPKWKVVLAAIFLKSKVSVSRSIIKMMWRRFALRVFGRTLSRGVLELASLPVFVFWNMWVMRKTVNELRFRSEIPLREDDIVTYILGDLTDVHQPQLDIGSTSLQDSIHMLTEHIYSVGDVHPNVERIFNRIIEREDFHAEVTTAPLRVLEGRFDARSDEQMVVAMRALCMALVVDPRRKRVHKKLIQRLLNGRTMLTFPSVPRLQQKILDGIPLQ